MINPRILRDTPEVVEAALTNRNADVSLLHQLQDLDATWRRENQALDALKAERNQSVPKGAPTPHQREALANLSATIKTRQQQVNDLDEARRALAMQIPNILTPDVPIGPDDRHNRVIRTVGTPQQRDFPPKSHDELATHLGIIDFDRAAKIAGSRFAIFKGLGARLERAIATFMLNTHVNDFGYCELSPPVLINTAALQGTGQLPKFKDDQYHVDNDYWLSPTAEVQLTNFHANEILSAADLPLKYCAFTPCFRKEAGSYGTDMKGLIRLHQFNKVELVQLVTPETSNDHLMTLLSHAETILQRLELPYRVVALCSGDTGFSAAQTFDLEVWLPAQNQYREISSCSNFLDFQAIRSKIRYRHADGSVRYLHTLNGSGLAVGRTMAAILENYQDASGNVYIPNALQGYMELEVITHES